jgi:DNA-binding response OmpR family regulator
MLGLFAEDRIVPHAELESVIARHRYRAGAKGRPLRVHLHYLRAKLLPYGVCIVSVRTQGFRLTAESRAVLAPYFAAAHALHGAAA